MDRGGWTWGWRLRAVTLKNSGHPQLSPLEVLDIFFGQTNLEAYFQEDSVKQFLSLVCAFALLGTAAFAADLTVEAQFNVTGKDTSKSFLTVKGPTASVEKDGVDPAKVDVVGAASMHKGTEVWNTYRVDAAKAGNFPLGFQNLVKYGVSNLAQFESDGFSAVKAKDGVITIQYVHRGYALKLVTDKAGKLDLEKGTQLMRAVGYIDGENQVLSTDFAPSGTIKDVDFAKIWDTKNAGGSVVGKMKTSPVLPDTAKSKTAYVGTVQFTLNGDILNIKAVLNMKK